MLIKRKAMNSYKDADFDNMSVETRAGEAQSPPPAHENHRPVDNDTNAATSNLNANIPEHIQNNQPSPVYHHRSNNNNNNGSSWHSHIIPQHQQYHQHPTTRGGGGCCSTTVHTHHHNAAVGGLYYGEPPRQYGNVVPVPLLKRFPALIQCPACRDVSATATRHVQGKGTHWMATFFFCFTGIGVFIPYVMDHFKNVEHTCTKCGRLVAVQRFGGGTQAKLL